MRRTEKEQIVAEVAERIARAQSMFLTDFTRMTVEEMNAIRVEFRKSGVEYEVTKNTLLRKALDSVKGFDGLYDYLRGPTAVAFSYDDPVAPAKVIKKFFDKGERPKLKVAVVEREIFDGSRLVELAQLPGKKELMAAIVGSLQTPAAGLVGIIDAVMRDLINVIEQVGKKKAEVSAGS
ncbi:MAG: 50S ribosomal protein L10 [Bacteroidota bacterium]